MAERESKDVKYLKAIRRAEFRLKQQLERIDFEEDVLIPEVQAFQGGKKALPPAKIVEIEQ